MAAPTSESPVAVAPPESPDPYASVSVPPPPPALPFSSSLDFPASDSSSTKCRPGAGRSIWNEITSALSDDQLLKKALEVYLSRNGIEKMKEIIESTTGQMFQQESAESLNSVLPEDTQVQAAPEPESSVNFETSDPVVTQKVYPVSAFAEMLRGAINEYPHQVGHVMDSGYLQRSSSGVSDYSDPFDGACRFITMLLFPLFPPLVGSE
jgi:hypothetical protein